jgi:hypothetical protein
MIDINGGGGVVFGGVVVRCVVVAIVIIVGVVVVGVVSRLPQQSLKLQRTGAQYASTRCSKWKSS